MNSSGFAKLMCNLLSFPTVFKFFFHYLLFVPRGGLQFMVMI